jgi:phosphoglycerate kinase
MANTFIFNQGIRIGKSLYEKNTEKITSMINNTAKKNNCEILLPIDFIVTTTITKNGLVKRAHLNNIPDQHIIADIGPKTIEIFAEKIKNSKTILWNGPLGIFEIEPFNKGTYSLAKKVAKLTKENKMESIAGGGDTISAIIKAGVAKSFTYTSLAGGAFLEWLEGKELPGIKALRINKKMI